MRAVDQISGRGAAPEARQVAAHHRAAPGEPLGERAEAGRRDPEAVEHDDRLNSGRGRAEDLGVQRDPVEAASTRRRTRGVRVDGHLVRYRAVGDGPPVVLVHGLGGSPRWWSRTTHALAEVHRVILPELPGFGFGLGFGRRVPFRLAEAPDVLRGLMDRPRPRRARRLVGHSLGALACAGVAARAPRRGSSGSS